MIRFLTAMVAVLVLADSYARAQDTKPVPSTEADVIGGLIDLELWPMSYHHYSDFEMILCDSVGSAKVVNACLEELRAVTERLEAARALVPTLNDPAKRQAALDAIDVLTREHRIMRTAWHQKYTPVLIMILEAQRERGVFSFPVPEKEF